MTNEDCLLANYFSYERKERILVPVIKADEHILRYANREAQPDCLEFYLPNFPIDIWVRSARKIDDMKEHSAIYWEFSETICYWILQVSDELKTHLDPLKLTEIDLIYDFDKLSFFEDHSITYNKDYSIVDGFDLQIDSRRIKIIIPKKIETFIGSPDNDGERILLSKILTAFGLLLSTNGLPNSLDQKNIEKIVEKHAPSGLKKMLLLLQTENDITLDPSFLVKPRYVQNAIEQLILDEIIPALGNKCPPIGEIIEKDKKIALTKSIVLKVLLPRLRNILKKYDSMELIKKLLAIYESLLHQNALKKLKTPTRMHCFKENEDLINELKVETSKSDETTLAVRCLIEHLAAEPTYGRDLISIETLDELIATMSLIIFWGNLGDLLNYNLFDIKLSVLRSGRIGTNSREIEETFFAHFLTARTKEYIEDTKESFSAKFDNAPTTKSSPPEALDSAFNEEIGISLKKLGGILHLFEQLGFEKKTSVPQISVVDFKKSVKESFEEPFTEAEINSAIDFLILKNRQKVDNIPLGFDSHDVSPWRYTRRLSYLQRPLILIDYGKHEDDPKLLWTPRNTHHTWKFLSELIHSGRYKAPEKSKLERVISKISQTRRVKLQEEGYSWFKKIPDLILDQEIKIGPSGKLKHNVDIGDIDIFVIDPQKKLLISVECKRTEPSRNMREMVGEVEKYFDSKEGYFRKHFNRHSWLEQNKILVGLVYQIELKDYKALSFFLTNEALSIQFMVKQTLPMPVLSLYELDKLNNESLIEILISKT